MIPYRRIIHSAAHLALGVTMLTCIVTAADSVKACAQTLGDSAIITDGSDAITPDQKTSNPEDVIVITLNGFGGKSLMTHAVADGGSAAFDYNGVLKGKAWDLHLKTRRDNERYVVFGTLFIGDDKSGAKPVPLNIVDVVDLSENDALIKIKDTPVSLRITRLQDRKEGTDQ